MVLQTLNIEPYYEYGSQEVLETTQALSALPLNRARSQQVVGVESGKSAGSLDQDRKSGDVCDDKRRRRKFVRAMILPFSVDFGEDAAVIATLLSL